MRLINVHTFELKEFFGREVPPYAILSHTWGEDEVTFQDWQNLAKASKKAGYSKILYACKEAKSRGIYWVWVDTNCIDKSSSAELTENINSMFRYYSEARLCFAYMSDVKSANTPDDPELLSQFRKSRWFTRGWTLQELLAPKWVIFFTRDWTRIGRKDEKLTDIIAEVTNIGKLFLQPDKLHHASVAKKMSWVSKRQTTRLEDMAYCMLGIFGVHMPLIYGEGHSAFARLQEEIIKNDNDQTIFCWTWDATVPENWGSFLAPSAAHFADSHQYERNELGFVGPGEGETLRPLFKKTFEMTNAGLSIELPALYASGSYFVVIAARAIPEEVDESNGDVEKPSRSICECIRVISMDPWDMRHVRRARYPSTPIPVGPLFPKNGGVFHRISQEPLLICKWHSYSTQQDDLEFQRWRATGHDGFVFFLSWESSQRCSSWQGVGTPNIDFCVRVTSSAQGTSIGALLAEIKVPTDTQATGRSRTAYLFLGVRNGAFFCQLFTPQNGQPLDQDQHNAALRDLRRQLLNHAYAFDQRMCVSEALETIIVVDGVKYDHVVRTNFCVLRLFHDRPGLDKPRGIFKLSGMN